MALFAITIFVAAFLLFQVQLLIAKYILPWFGGGPAVWTTSMLFFQVLLLAGYAYAHVSIRQLRPRGQAAVHLGLLLAALAFLPITPSAHWKPDTAFAPTVEILLLLSISIGLPYFVLASTSPLLQGWFGRLWPSVSPYRLYALSNVGSLLALVSYPFLVEPVLARSTQATVWSWGFGLFAVVCGACAAWICWRRPAPMRSAKIGLPSDDAAPQPELVVRVLWLGLPAAASILLLAVTNQISQEMAVIPFLWVLPLSLYLLSFIICFDREKWYHRLAWTCALVLAMPAIVWVMYLANDASIPLQISVYSIVLFICCMACHGELARLKPPTTFLTAYYLAIATGGALGGVFVAVVAPLVFSLFLELHVGLLACCGLVLVALFADKQSMLHRRRSTWGWGAISIAYVSLAVALSIQARQFSSSAVVRSRNFYGILTVARDAEYTSNDQILLRNGVTWHGLQFLAPDQRRWPTMYYSEISGVGVALQYFPRQVERRIGVVGLGVGTIAAYGRSGDYIRMYEINPEVDRIARTYFRYLTDTEAQVDVILGDARLSLERESSQAFDILVLDAFNSDAIPAHLLTKEAFEIYARHLKPDGVIAVHISNRHFNLQPLLRQLAQHLELESLYVENGDAPGEIWRAKWMLLTKSREFLDTEIIQELARGTPETEQQVKLWTDDYINLFQLLDR